MACATHVTTHLTTNEPHAASPGHPAPKSRIGRFFHMMARQKWRKALLLMDERLLKDMGITRERALLEASKWFWQD